VLHGGLAATVVMPLLDNWWKGVKSKGFQPGTVIHVRALGEKTRKPCPTWSRDKELHHLLSLAITAI
jgi:hypothetical protein